MAGDGGRQAPVAHEEETSAQAVEEDGFFFLNLDEAEAPERRAVPTAAEAFTAVRLEPGVRSGGTKAAGHVRTTLSCIWSPEGGRGV